MAQPACRARVQSTAAGARLRHTAVALLWACPHPPTHLCGGVSGELVQHSASEVLKRKQHRLLPAAHVPLGALLHAARDGG